MAIKREDLIKRFKNVASNFVNSANSLKIYDSYKIQFVDSEVNKILTELAQYDQELHNIYNEIVGPQYARMNKAHN